MILWYITVRVNSSESNLTLCALVKALVFNFRVYVVYALKSRMALNSLHAYAHYLHLEFIPFVSRNERSILKTPDSSGYAALSLLPFQIDLGIYYHVTAQFSAFHAMTQLKRDRAQSDLIN